MITNLTPTPALKKDEEVKKVGSAYKVFNFAYSFKTKESTPLTPDSKGIYNPRTEAEAAFLAHQAKAGRITKV